MIFLWIFVIFFMHKKCEWLCDLLARSTTSQRQRHSLSEQAGCSVAVWRSTSDGVSLTLPPSRAEQARRHITVSMTASCEQEAQQNGRRCKPSDRHGNQVSLLNFHVIWTNRLLIIFSTYPKSNKYFTIFAKKPHPKNQQNLPLTRWFTIQILHCRSHAVFLPFSNSPPLLIHPNTRTSSKSLWIFRLFFCKIFNHKNVEKMDEAHARTWSALFFTLLWGTGHRKECARGLLWFWNFGRWRHFLAGSSRYYVVVRGKK